MTQTYTLTDEGVKKVKASEAFQALTPEQADVLHDVLHDFFWGCNAIPRETVHLRLDRVIENVRPDDPKELRHVILEALGVLSEDSSRLTARFRSMAMKGLHGTPEGMRMLEDRIGVVADAVRLATKMRDLGVARNGYSKILRETIFFSWELADGPKHGEHRPRSAAARGLKPSGLDYDHAIPIRIVIDELLDAGPDPSAVERILRARVRAVLITKEEHAHLRSCGLSSRMPGDWDGVDWRARYVAAGIAIPDQPDA